MFGWFFAQALLYAYAFTAINRVSSGNTTNFMPEISDVGDLIKTVVLATGAMIVSAGPMILLILLGLGAALSMIGGGLGGGDSAFDQPGAPPPSSGRCSGSRA